MSKRGSKPSTDTGPDILARYLQAYAHSRQLSDLERPWGLGDDGLDHLWGRLVEALAGDPHELDRLIGEELEPVDREHIVATITPLIFALPMRAFPVEVRALRSGPRLELLVRTFLSAEEDDEDQGLDEQELVLAKVAPDSARVPKRKRRTGDHPLGHLPGSLTEPLAEHLRKVLGFQGDEQRREVTVSSGGRRRRVRITILSRNRGVLIRFLHRFPSPTEEGA